MTEDDRPGKGLTNFPDRLIIGIGNKAAWLTAVLIVMILVQVVLRYLFQTSFVALEEIQWHLYAVIIMLSISYSFVKDTHIRLDIVHSRLSKPTKQVIEILGIILFLWPIAFVFFIHSLEFVSESFRVGERSDAPMGLGYRWAIKSVIPVSFFLLFLGSLSRLFRAVSYLKNRLGKPSDGC